MEQVIVGGIHDLLEVVGADYNRLAGGYNWNSTERYMEQLVSTDGKLKNLRIKLNDVPGTGTYVFTLRLNGAPTALTCEVAADGTMASDTAHEVTITGGDRICLQGNPSVDPAPDNARYVRWTIMFEGDTVKESLILGGVANNVDVAATEYNQIAPTDAGPWHVDEEGKQQVIPTAGKIKNLYVNLPAQDPGDDGVDAYRFTLRKGGISQTLTVKITAPNRTGNDTAHEVAVAAGDIVTLMCQPISSPAANPQAIWGMTFVADTDGESLILGSTSSSAVPQDDRTNFIKLTGGSWTVTEANCYQLGQACTLKKLYVELQNDPDPGSLTFTLRKPGNGQADGNLTVTITAGNNTGNDVAHTDVISDDEELDLESIPSDIPTVGQVYWGLVCFIAVAPTVTTQAADPVGSTTATGKGTITDTGGENATKRGIVYNTTGDPTREPSPPGATPVVESTTPSNQDGDSTSFVMDMPAIRPDGDLYIAWVAKDDDDAFTVVPGNWIEIDVGVSGIYLLCGLWYWFGSSEPETYTVEGDSEEWSGAILRISGAHTVSPINKTGVANIGVSATAEIPEVTPDCDNPLLLAFAGIDTDFWNVADQYPDGWDGLFTQNSGSSEQYSANAIGASKSGEKYIPSGAGVFTANDSDGWRAMVIAISPTPPIPSSDDYEEEEGDFGVGAFTRDLTGLDPETKYYAKAYATNVRGTGYGAQIDFTTRTLRVPRHGFVNFQVPGMV